MRTPSSTTPSSGQFYEAFATPRDPARAVLIAAMACEVKVKERLRAVVAPEAGALLDVLLGNPRDYSLAAQALFDQPALAVTGRSLRADDRALFKRVGRLFELRNRIAHRGELPTADDAREALRAAVGAFRWLDGLGPPR